MSSLMPLLARQPIFNRKIQVVAYELLCRSAALSEGLSAHNDRASSQVLLHSFTELSIDSVVGRHQAFINFTRNLLINPPPFDRRQLVIEVLEGQLVDGKLLHSLRDLRNQGYTIALDDFVLNDETEALLAYADIVKLDLLALSGAQLETHVERIKSLGITLLAEKVETHDVFAQCKEMGFDLFQGYFLAHPKVIHGRRVAENKQAVLQLMSALHDPDVPIDHIEKLIARDPALSYKLLRLVNSAAFALPRTIESLRQAITLLGLNIIRNWVNLLAMANLGDKPLELSISALTRARMCEMIAHQINPRQRHDSFFTVGLLSTLDAFMDAPLDELLESISLSSNLKDALLHHLGEEGKVLDIVEHYERAEWEKIDWRYLNNHRLEDSLLSRIYLDSLKWVASTAETAGIKAIA